MYADKTRGITMYDLRNLNDYEFEYLSLDIMERILDNKLYRFPRGKDGGIDLCDEIENPKIIVQVKHYKNFSNLKSTIINTERKKVENINPENYYLCTSCELTRDNKIELYNILKPYIKSADNIISGVDISNFIEKDENQDIVKKHYKLWLAASNVLSLINNKKVFIDCDELVYDIEKKSKLFVETEGYINALEKLKKDNIIIIVGAPGVGKSTISKMILLKYVSDEYSVRYVSDNDIGDIKNVLSNNKEAKEIVLLDDFLGQHYLNLKESEPNELKSLCAFIKRNPNKKLVMNSRITILSEARNKFITFNELMEEYDENKYLIDLDKMSQVEKARIFYNHIYFNDLPKEYFMEIQRDSRYLKIIGHRNYNPRIIEYVTKTKRVKQIKVENYYKYIIDNLDNPKDVWKDEFENRLEVSDRKLMFTLYSLTNRYIDINLLNRVYGKYINKDSQIDKSLNIFERVTSRLSDSLINKISKEKNIEIGVLNPSINDYMKNELDSNINQVMDIVKNAVYIEQILKFDQHKEVRNYIYGKILSGEFLKFETIEKSIFFYYIKFIAKNEIKDKKIESAVKLAFERSYENLTYSLELREYSELLNDIFLNKFELLKFYDMIEILFDSNKMRFIFQNIDYETMKSYLKRIGEIYESNVEYEILYQDILDEIKEYLIDKMMNTIGEMTENDLYDIAEKVINGAKKEDIEDFKIYGYGNLLDEMSIDVYKKITEIANELIVEIDDFIIIDIEKLDIEEIETHMDIEEYLYDCINNLEYTEDSNTSNKETMDELKEIRIIFERNFEEK